MARRTLRDKRVLVTGATSGIGAALALELAAAGCRLLLTGRRADRLAEVAARAQTLAPHVATLAGDLLDPLVRRALADTATAQFQGLDILINNAGLGAWGPFAEADEARLRQLMEVNFFAPAELTRVFLPLLRAGDQPMLVNLGSVLGQRAVPNKSEYCASKFALHGLSDALRAELAPWGIDVLHACPSTTRTEFFERVLTDDPAHRPMPHQRVRGVMTPAAVARRIVRAIRQGRHEIVLSCGGKALVWLDRLWPWLADQLIARFAAH